MDPRTSRKILPGLVLMLAGLIASCAAPTAKIKVSRNDVKQGEPVTVSWETKNAKTVELNGKQVKAIDSTTVTPNESTAYEIVAARGKKNARDKATVNVDIPKPAPTAELNVTQDAVERGQTTTLKWTTTNSKIVTISGVGSVSASGQQEVSPRVSTTYTLTATGDGGTATDSKRITVNDPPPPPAPVVETPAEPPIAEQFRAIMKPVFFELDKSELSSVEQDKLRAMAEWLNRGEHTTIVFRIEGNCDPRGTAEYNLGLGDRRARAVKDFLVGLGIDTNRIESISYGLEKAQGTVEGISDAPPSWAFDRRGDFIYLRGGDRP